MGAEWSPWGELLRREHLLFSLEELPAGVDGVYWPIPDGGAAILIDRRLSRRERKAVLAHELVHDERGGARSCMDGMPPTWRDVVRREEQHIDREVARRLVPPMALQELVARTLDLGEPLHATAVMEEFDVPIDVAHRAMWLFEQGGTA